MIPKHICIAKHWVPITKGQMKEEEEKEEKKKTTKSRH